MTRHILVRWVAAAACIPMLAACGSDSRTTSEPAVSTGIDLNAALSAMSFADVNAFLGLRGLLATPSTGANPTIIPSACAYSATTQSFNCPTSTAGGLTYTTSYFLYNAASQPQSQLDLATTAAVRTVVDATGTTPIPSSNGTSGSVAVTRHTDLTLSGLQGTTRTLNGTTREHDDLTTTGTFAGHSVIDLVTTSNNVVLPLENAAKIRPTAQQRLTFITFPVQCSVAWNSLTYQGNRRPTKARSAAGGRPC